MSGTDGTPPSGSGAEEPGKGDPAPKDSGAPDPDRTVITPATPYCAGHWNWLPPFLVRSAHAAVQSRRVESRRARAPVCPN